MPFNIQQHLDDITTLRHDLHAMAEVSNNERKTSKFVTEFLEDTSPSVLQTGVGGNGLFATYNGKEEGPHIVIRCELDGLPITDDVEVPYQSTTTGVGHKCGHDGHMAIVCGLAKLLGESSPESGKVTLLFQPAEETGEGAQRVLADPKFKQLSPNYCFALHNLPGFEKHQIVIRKDVFAAASVGLIVNFKGATSHAAHPEQGRSPAMAMAQTVQALSAAPQFYSSLEEVAKVTVINARLGERAFGTSPGEATVMATLRTYDDDVLKKLREKCVAIAERTADTYDLSVDYEWVEEFASTRNDAEATAQVRSAAEALGVAISEKEHPFSWSEDFGHFTSQIPGAMFGLGVGQEHPSLHAEQYDFEDEIIPTGISMFMQIINDLTT